MVPSIVIRLHWTQSGVHVGGQEMTIRFPQSLPSWTIESLIKEADKKLELPLVAHGRGLIKMSATILPDEGQGVEYTPGLFLNIRG